MGPGNGDASRRQIRGGSLLLSGRLLAICVNFAGQVLIVRYLATSDYGAWAYALSVVALLQTLAPLGLDRAAARFVPIFHENRQPDKVAGAIFLVIGTILFVSIAVIAALFLFPGPVARLIEDGRHSLALLFILI